MTDADLGFVHRFLPPQRPGLPTLLLLHGTGGDENDLLPLARLLLPDAGVLSPRGKVSEQGMPRFFRRLAEGVFDLEDLHFRTHELAAFTEAAARRYDFDPSSVIAVGFSNGANIAASLLLTRPDVLRGAVLFHAQVPFEPQEQPNLPGVLVFLSGGRADHLIPPRETERLADLLRLAGADVALYWQSNGHTLTRDEVEAARGWMSDQATRLAPLNEQR